MANVELSSPSVVVQPTFEVAQEERDLYPQLTDEQIIGAKELGVSFGKTHEWFENLKKTNPMKYFQLKLKTKIDLIKDHPEWLFRILKIKK